jgi:hypothetical protein
MTWTVHKSSGSGRGTSLPSTSWLYWGVWGRVALGRCAISRGQARSTAGAPGRPQRRTRGARRQSRSSWWLSSWWLGAVRNGASRVASTPTASAIPPPQAHGSEGARAPGGARSVQGYGWRVTCTLPAASAACCSRPTCARRKPRACVCARSPTATARLHSPAQHARHTQPSPAPHHVHQGLRERGRGHSRHGLLLRARRSLDLAAGRRRGPQHQHHVYARVKRGAALEERLHVVGHEHLRTCGGGRWREGS